MIETFDLLPTIPVFLDAKAAHSGVPSYIGWNTANSTLHHCLVAGGTGSGKSTFLMLQLAKMQKYMPPSTRLYLMDFKGSDDFRYLQNLPNARYFSHTQCVHGLQAFSEEVESRLHDNLDRSPIIAVFDEYASFISYTNVTDKKLAAQCQMWIMNALFMSRSVGGYLFLCTQRPDQTIMPGSGARDQFGFRVWWGRFSSTDAAQMMFGDMYKQIPTDYNGGVGHGIAYIEGKGLIEVFAPRIRNMATVKDAIADLVTR